STGSPPTYSYNPTPSTYPSFRDWEMAAMASVQDFNDGCDTTYDLLMERLRGVRVHCRKLPPPVVVRETVHERRHVGLSG
ncbi:MAG TPA: hypothetical protein PKY77_06630, partial [Phycisphaerae bacterium]|nr:hypothetical protein [Phycisphaerae bacterium]HRY69650.1 hypothetical protein [Phycisphaerae bacterium]